MGGDSCSKGREFESQHQLLDRHFSHLFIVKIKNCNDFLEKIVNKNGKKATSSLRLEPATLRSTFCQATLLGFVFLVIRRPGTVAEW